MSKALYLCLFLLSVSPLSGQGFITSSLEQYNYQVGPNLLVVNKYESFDEISEDFTEVDSLAVSVDGDTPYTVDFEPFYNTYKKRHQYDTLPEMLAERPNDVTYTHTLTGTPSGSVLITAPGIAYENAIPNHPVFTIEGADGVWGRTPNGAGRFYFDPASVTDQFTVTMNAYNVTTPGSHYVYAVYLADITDGFNYIGEYSSDLVETGQSPEGIPAQLQLTFTVDTPDPGAENTYQFTASSRFEIEGEHVNIFGLTETTDQEIGQGLGLKAFPYQSVTAFELIASANPTSEVTPASSITVTDQAIGAQDGVNNHFFLDWDAAPAEAGADVYRSEDLDIWTKVSSLNQFGSYSEPMTPGGKAFFTVVPTGETP